MSVATLVTTDDVLAGEVLAHLELQLIAAQRLLAVVLEQGAAIRRREVQAVVEQTGRLQTELQRRLLLDQQRTGLLERAAARLGVGAGAVSLSLLEALMEPSAGARARAMSAELRGMLDEVQREHHVNRALMQQELSFLDHLLSLAQGPGGPAYTSSGGRTGGPSTGLGARHRVFDLEV